MYFWISWVQPTEDHRPLTFPPNESILGWWMTGIGSDGATLVSVVKAGNREQAESAVTKDWPEAKKWRFCELIDHYEDFKLGYRYPLQDWMKSRFEKSYLPDQLS